jgi:hypothetical protein
VGRGWGWGWGWGGEGGDGGGQVVVERWWDSGGHVCVGV